MFVSASISEEKRLTGYGPYKSEGSVGLRKLRGTPICRPANQRGRPGRGPHHHHLHHPHQKEEEERPQLHLRNSPLVLKRGHQCHRSNKGTNRQQISSRVHPQEALQLKKCQL